MPRYAPATTLNGGGKEFLRTRLLQIKQPTKHGKGAILLALMLCATLAGCGAMLGSAAQPQANQPLAEDEPQSAPAAPSDPVLPEGVLASSTAPIPTSDAVLVTVRDYIPNLFVDLKYATADNLTGMPLYSFTEPQLRYGTVKKLVKAQQLLNQQGYSLKIWDAYRPMEAQQALWQACPDPAYVSDPATGYLGHTRGNTVDVTLVTLDGKELAMPSGFDQFDARADRDYSDVSAEAAKHATALQTAMEAAGFVGYAAEWSHYYDSVEYPKIEASFLTAQQAYTALLAGDTSLLNEEDSARWWVPQFSMLGICYEYAYLDLDGDGADELLVQMAGSPEGYNGVFHFENDQLWCWNSDAAEGNCRDYPLRSGTMVRQYDLGGSRSYTLFRYRSDGTMEQTAQLFERWERMEGEEPAPCPYYTVNGTEVDKATFEAQLAALVTDQLPEPTFWNTL
ncbi:MAG: M15 family metallopeptidase [Faecalibacterium sp.]|nr:M15 family metallopeptidase [Faecalibacterium sp.]